MKNRITMILIIVLIAVTGCQSNTVQKPDTHTANEYNNLVITDIIYDKSTKIISYEVENRDSETITTGIPYIIEKYENKNWNKTNLTDDMLFIEIALLLDPNQKIEEKIDLSQINKLKDGYYRIKKEYFSKSGTINQYIEFKSLNKDISNFSSYNSIKK